MNWFSLWEDAKLGVVFCLSTLCMWSFSCTTQSTPHFWWYNTSTFPPLLPTRGVLAVAHWEESTGWNVLQLAVAGMSSEFISSLSLIRPLNTSRGFRNNFLTSAGLSCTGFFKLLFLKNNWIYLLSLCIPASKNGEQLPLALVLCSTHPEFRKTIAPTEAYSILKTSKLPKTRRKGAAWLAKYSPRSLHTCSCFPFFVFPKIILEKS